MEKYKINGRLITMPTGWHDVKYKDALHIIETQPNAVQLFSMFSGMKEKEVEALNKQDDIYYFMRGFPFLETSPITKQPDIPRTIKYKGESYSFPHVLFDDPFDFGETSAGQIEDMKAISITMTTELLNGEDRSLTPEEVYKLYPMVVAIYIQKIIEKKYSYKRAVKMADELQNEMSFKEVVYMGNFFLLKLANLTNGLHKGLHRRSWIKKKLRLGFKTLTRILESSQQ
jgi:hypothetical protein